MSSARIIHTENRTQVQFKMPIIPLWLTIYENRGNLHSAEMWLEEHIQHLQGHKLGPCLTMVKYY